MRIWGSLVTDSIQPVPQLLFHRAEDLLAELDEAHPRWGGFEWLFRGQNDASWPLLPRTFRKGSLAHKYVKENFESQFRIQERRMPDEELRAYVTRRFGPILSTQFSDGASLSGYVENNLGFIRRNYVMQSLASTFEFLLVRSFTELADRANLVTPFDPLKSYWDKPLTLVPLLTDDRTNSENSINWQEEPMRVMYALAQHHGLPTRLLDWTYRQDVAMFFAAHEEPGYKVPDCKRSNSPSTVKPKNLIIWAVQQAALNTGSLRVVKHNRSQIGFLRQQDGLFVYDKNASDWFTLFGRWCPFEMLFQDFVDMDAVYRLVMPYSQKAKLLELLERKGITKARLMPSFDNVAAEVMSNYRELIMKYFPL